MRKFNRKNFETREISIQKNFVENSDGSCLICFGKTMVICTAIIENDVPGWLKGKGTGWVTAEYGMLPGSTSSRNRRESKLGKQTGRTTEIQRLIGRSLRSIIDLNCLGEKSIIVDCDVIQADGGTRTASITGGFVALSLAIKKYMSSNKSIQNPIKDYVAAISCGILKNEVLVDLDYSEDSIADVDANFVITQKSGFSEVQATGEENTFQKDELVDMMEKVELVSEKIFAIQQGALE
jgi:ribonuclease PH